MKIFERVAWIGASCSLLVLGACHGSTTGSGNSDSGTTAQDCESASTHIEQVVCASNAFLATLTDEQKAAVQYEWTNEVAKTAWSNLPPPITTRNGLTWGSLSAESRAAELKLASLVLTSDGYADMTGVWAADDYLGSYQGSGTTGGDGGTGGPPRGDGGMGGPPGGDGGMGGPPGGDGGMGGGGGGAGLSYSSNNYIIAFIGTPSTTGNWMLQIGGHHMAYNVTYLNGTGYPTPNHIGAEPKASFTDDAGTFAPLADEGAAMVALYTSLDSTQLTSAHLTGTFSDVVLGPVEYQTGSYANVKFPTQAGVLVSSMTAAQQALVTAAIKKWVADFAPAISDPLVAAYTSADAYAHTYVAWGGSEDVTAGPNVDVDGTYLRIDGPRLWIEVACQGGVVIQGITHYHTIYRDKQFDYGNELSP